MVSPPRNSRCRKSVMPIVSQLPASLKIAMKGSVILNANHTANNAFCSEIAYRGVKYNANITIFINRRIKNS